MESSLPPQPPAGRSAAEGRSSPRRTGDPRGSPERAEAGGRTWTVRESGTPSIFLNIAFPDPTVGWIAGNSGALLQTLDGGEKWEDRSLAQPVDLTSLAFTDIKTGWVVGDRGAIFRTTDGGFTWSPYGRSPQTTFYGAAFRDGKTGVAVGDKGIIVQIAVR